MCSIDLAQVASAIEALSYVIIFIGIALALATLAS